MHHSFISKHLTNFVMQLIRFKNFSPYGRNIIPNHFIFLPIDADLCIF